MHKTTAKGQQCRAYPSGVGGHEQGQDACEDTDAGYQEKGKAPSLHPQRVAISHTGSKEAACHATCSATTMQSVAASQASLPSVSKGRHRHCGKSPSCIHLQARLTSLHSTSAGSHAESWHLSCHCGEHPPRLDVKNSSPKALPLDAEEYVSAIRDCTHGITSAKPRPFHALKLIACIGSHDAGSGLAHPCIP